MMTSFGMFPVAVQRLVPPLHDVERVVEQVAVTAPAGQEEVGVVVAAMCEVVQTALASKNMLQNSWLPWLLEDGPSQQGW